MKIVDIVESTRPISSNIRNAFIDFSKMTLSLVAVITDVVRKGRPVIRWTTNCRRAWAKPTPGRWPPARTCSRCRMRAT